MAKMMVPIIKLKHDSGFSLEAYDVLHGSPGYQELEDYTFTFRLSVSPEVDETAQAERERIKQRLRESVPEEAEALIALLEEHEFDVSFFVDTF